MISCGDSCEVKLTKPASWAQQTNKVDIPAAPNTIPLALRVKINARSSLLWQSEWRSWRSVDLLFFPVDETKRCWQPAGIVPSSQSLTGWELSKGRRRGRGGGLLTFTTPRSPPTTTTTSPTPTLRWPGAWGRDRAPGSRVSGPTRRGSGATSSQSTVVSTNFPSSNSPRTVRVVTRSGIT